MRVNLKSNATLPDLRVLGDYRAEFENQSRLLRGIWDRPDAEVAFGGHFSCGKSTLLCSLTGRDILPVGDLPETGVPCHLRGGLRDQVVAVGPGAVTRPLAWSSAVIAEHIGLYDRNGARRSAEDMPDRIDIDIDSPALAAGVIWTDTPGINDNPEVTERALDLALDADVLVWVLSSRQCFSEPEFEFLKRFVERRGTNALAFVLNVFLPDDDAESWELFNAREGRILRERIAERMELLGLSHAPLHILSARAAIGGHDENFGSAPFRHWLLDISSRSAPIVRASRSDRIARMTEILRDKIALRQVAAEAMRLAEQRKEDLRQKAMADRKACLADVRILIDETMEDFGREALAVAERIGKKIDEDGLVRESHYGSRLAEALKAELPADSYCDQIDLILARYRFSSLTSARRREIGSALTIDSLSVTVPQTPFKVATAGTTAVVLGVLFAPFTGGLSVLGTTAALGAGALAASAAATLEDVVGTKENLTSAAAAEHRRLAQASQAILASVDKALGAVPDATPKQGASQLAALTALDKHYKLLADNPELAHS